MHFHVIFAFTACHFWLLESVSTYFYFMPSLQAVPPTPPPSPPRTIYYPVRTNCMKRICVPQTRYRWNFRPTASNGWPKPGPLPQRPLGGGYRPYIPAPQPPPNTLPPITPATSTVQPTTTVTIRPTTMEIMTLSPDIMPTEAGKVVDKKPYEELPTPPPYTQNVPNKRPNPCADGKPLMNEYKNPITCNFVVQPNGGCPEEYFCHTGSSYDTTTCCPSPATLYKGQTGASFGERCHLPRTNGEGEDLIPRWYFDTTIRKCKRFLYKGLKGNANNFVTSIQCMETCETADRAATLKNPCASGPPARGLDGELFSCGVGEEVKDAKSCPAGYFCHIGESSETTVCCEITSNRNICALAVAVGEGTANLRRYYYDTVTQKCVEFLYSGTKGNENNFLSAQQCRNACIKYTNPCPVLFDYGERKECTRDTNLCDKNEWCHIGSSLETTACCPGGVPDPCKLGLDLGQGTENITRWHADPLDNSCNRECSPFSYRGTKGNQNNFVSKEQCEAVCKPECYNPCSSGDLLVEASGSPRLCNTSSPCPVNHWCHLGATTETTGYR